MMWRSQHQFLLWGVYRWMETKTIYAVFGDAGAFLTPYVYVTRTTGMPQIKITGHVVTFVCV